MLKASFLPYNLIFKSTVRTSRAEMNCKQTYFIKLWDDSHPSVYGVGECALFRGLSYDDNQDYENILAEICQNIGSISISELSDYPSIVFGIETALRDLNNGGKRIIFDSPWIKGKFGITINGLIWMGTEQYMSSQLTQKTTDGYKCIKIKIGGIDFNRELELLKWLRQRYTKEELTIRLDANGAFTPDNAIEKLEQLARFDIHSIEQPIEPLQYQQMSDICQHSPIPIALDEELIGLTTEKAMAEMLNSIRPQYIILKPSLCGGFIGASAWIKYAESNNIGWWVTSALESNIGLNAIAQWTATLNNPLPQGLGTGSLYTNNIPSPLFLANETINYNPNGKWNFSQLGL